MKRIIYIVIALFGLGMASCSKQEINPISNDTLVAPEWSSNERGTGDAAEGDDSGSTSGDNGSNSSTGDNDITDPNNDPDGSKKGKGSK